MGAPGERVYQGRPTSPTAVMRLWFRSIQRAISSAWAREGLFSGWTPAAGRTRPGHRSASARIRRRESIPIAGATTASKF